MKNIQIEMFKIMTCLIAKYLNYRKRVMLLLDCCTFPILKVFYLYFSDYESKNITDLNIFMYNFSFFVLLSL
jgi:hypothetical protein